MGNKLKFVLEKSKQKETAKKWDGTYYVFILKKVDKKTNKRVWEFTSIKEDELDEIDEKYRVTRINSGTMDIPNLEPK